jgi:exonuclease III
MYIINKNGIISMNQIHEELLNYFKNDEFKLKRIRKKRSYYVRLIVNISIETVGIQPLLKKAGKNLSCAFKEQFLKRNRELENSVKEDSKLMSILSLNINGINNKIEELNLLLNRYNPDVVCIQETKRRGYEKRLFLNSYSVIEVPAENNSLGMLLGVKKKTNIEIRVIENSADLIIVEARGKKTNMIVGNVYRSHNAARRNLTMQKACQVLKNYENKKIVMVGDWNATPDMMNKFFVKKNINVFLDTAPIKGTRISRNRHTSRRAVDFGIANMPNLITAQSVKRGWRLSDHFPVLVKLSMEITHKDNQLREVFDRQKLQNQKVAGNIKDLGLINTQGSLQDVVTSFYHQLNEKLILEKVIRKEIKPEKGLYISKKVKKAIKLKRQVDIKVSRNLATIEQLIDARKTVKAEIQSAKRKKYLGFIKTGINYIKGNDAKNSWKWLKMHSNLNNRQTISNSVYEKDSRKIVSDPVKVNRLWTEHFMNLCKRPPINANTGGLPRNVDYSDLTDCEITWGEISSTLKSIRNGKAAGLDRIPGEVYKLVSNEQHPTSNLAKGIMVIINRAFSEKEFPMEWNDSIVVPIYKKGNKLEPNNYRGISLINTLLKVLAKILASRLQLICSRYPLLGPEQSGFITQEECVSQTACLIECCQRRKIRGRTTIIGFLDLKKAYDLVPHDLLLDRLRESGLGEIFISFISRMYENTTLRVRSGNITGESFRYERGVRQGCPTSPLLFNIFINSLLVKINPVQIEGLRYGLKGLMFADDTVIAADSRLDLEEKLGIIQHWMIENQMEINPEKCGIMEINQDSFCPQGKPVLYDGIELPNVNKYVYLGTEINNSLNLYEMAKYRLGIGRSTLLQIKPTIGNNSVPMEYKRMLINNILIPRIMFGSEIYGMCEKRVYPLKRIIDNAFKCIVRKSNFCRIRTYEEFDIETPHVLSAANRARGLSKWKDSRGLLRELIAGYQSFKSRKRTWVKEAFRWLKAMNIDVTLPTKELVHATKNNRKNLMFRKDQSLIGQFARNLSIRSGKVLRKAEVEESLDSRGLIALMRIRTGTYMFSNSLILKHNLESSFKDKCLFCKVNTKEEAWHMLIECQAFSRARRKYLAKHLKNFWNPILQKPKILSLLLGGGQVASRLMKLPRAVMDTVCYLAHLVPRRSAILAEYLGPADRS